MDSRIRHLAKSVTWRIIASATTFSLTLGFFGKAEIAKASWLTVLEAIIKILVYYFHERAWFKLSTKMNTKTRHLMKAVTWRIIASGTTFILALIFFRSHEGAIEKAMWVALIEAILKMILYYGHDEVWYRINLGLDNRKDKRSLQ